MAGIHIEHFATDLGIINTHCAGTVADTVHPTELLLQIGDSVETNHALEAGVVVHTL